MVLDVLREGSGPSEQEEPLVDMIAVHGLNPSNKNTEEHGYGTWRSGKGDDKQLWLENLDKTFPRARVMLEYYDASALSFDRRESFLNQANGILEDIRVKRKKIKAPNRPIIFLMHSLGGIMIKQALVEAKQNEKYLPILEATRCLMFFGTPHGGGNTTLVNWGGAAAATARFLTGQARTDLFSALDTNSVLNEHLKEHFLHLYEKVWIVYFYERLSNIVPMEHAALHLGGLRENIVGLDAKHSDLCRFDLKSKKNKRIFEMVIANLDDLYEKALEGPEGQGELLSLPETPQTLPGSDRRQEVQADDVLERGMQRLRS